MPRTTSSVTWHNRKAKKTALFPSDDKQVRKACKKCEKKNRIRINNDNDNNPQQKHDHGMVSNAFLAWS